ncbi:hypothetical protein C2I18_16940 [Paenibacillus sp. PK3_47]|uniref:hypothetical protein n=1 Tax=Paenibacillus sp. PK3_47 TaxID=2072642 RepID=UPI00201DE5F2|nr:hypothetical protein [Paenibacillus sp. PK3_47]UQZ35059.1 hypothetical protein C2I18_16940 [Paenibacillus sp. PK3_47]
MQASIQPVVTWSQNRIFAGTVQNLELLVEWSGSSGNQDFRKKSRKVAAREIELRIWLESHMTLSGCHGCNAERGEGGSFLFKLGKIHSGSRKYIGLAFTTAAMPAGVHEAIWMQWQYKQPPAERIRELPLNKLSLEYTHHTDILNAATCFHVEKHMELLKAAEAMEALAVLRSREPDQKVYEKLRRQADKVLLLAARSGDLQLVKEAEMLYKQLSV